MERKNAFVVFGQGLMTDEMNDALENPKVVQKDIVPIYARMIALERTSGMEVFEWSEINASIADKWSQSGMASIKTAAWKELETQANSKRSVV